MIKLALPLEGSRLAHHFGHSKLFYFAEVADKKIINTYTKVPPPHSEGVIPRWLIDEKVTDLLVGGIGPKAINILNNNKMNVYVGVEEGEAEQLTANFVEDDLKYGKNYCHH
jgi:predicted Fe-Mo cluster-binding NifX family protein